MGTSTCRKCGNGFDPSCTPHCPDCLAVLWRTAPALIREKHDSRRLPMAWESYRSVLSPHFIESVSLYLDDAARRGAWFIDRHYDMRVHFTHLPLGRAPGSGIPKGQKQPDHALDSLLIAEADDAREAHAFAVSREQFEAQVRVGEFVPVGPCDEPGCSNLRIPDKQRCGEHERACPTAEDGIG